MTREQAMLIARECAAAQPESYCTNPFDSFTPHEWVITAIMTAGARYEHPHEHTGAMVLDFRDCFLTLVQGYNRVGAYNAAQAAQAMAIALNKFEADHPLTGVAWPLEVIQGDEGDVGLKMADGGIAYGSDL